MGQAGGTGHFAPHVGHVELDEVIGRHSAWLSESMSGNDRHEAAERQSSMINSASDTHQTSESESCSSWRHLYQELELERI